jgi:peptidoglycan/xylan/chitin deacetylase (PgdA/CDA1 family)
MSILAYHMVEPRFDLAVTRVKPAQFRAQLECALSAGYSIMPLADYLQMSRPRTKALALTFDDAYASVYENAFPLLRAYGIRATVFVLADYIGKLDDWDVNFGHIRFPHMTVEQIGELAVAGWEIGSHTCQHWDLTRLSRERLEEEVGGSKQKLERLFGREVHAISYPFGNADLRVVECCKAAGYHCGVVMGRFDKQLEVNYALPRLGVYLFDFPWLFSKKIVAKYEKMFNFIQRGIDVCSDGTVLVKQGFEKPIKSA